MKKSYEARYHKLESEHWWFRSRRNAILGHLRQLSNVSELKVLDIGCSIGLLMDDMLTLGFKREHIYGIDISEKGIKATKERGWETTSVMDAQEVSLDENQFDVIVSSDCLEHLEHDQKALDNWFRLLKPGGTAIIYVPAFMALWSVHDVANQHFRRYSRKELTKKMKHSGFTIQKSSYWNTVLFIPIYIFRALHRWLNRADREHTGDISLPGTLINGVLMTLLKMENAINKVVSFPFGVSVYAIAKKN